MIHDYLGALLWVALWLVNEMLPSGSLGSRKEG